jgi:hypothetical protein
LHWVLRARRVKSIDRKGRLSDKFVIIKIQMAEAIRKYRFGDVAEKGREIYQKIKGKYEPQYTGKFLAIDPKTEKVYMADTLDEVYDLAHAENPHTSFYLMRIGYLTIGTMASVFFD